ncbi:DUF4145 domain-containing protein [Clostridium beijerinckii]|uniref:DUF4145 domain-containing protein n=1 Tax=Clostridium beijerinckii TaxID=1520 RepID=UPI00156E9B7A|nr:DUF4145 domain-containing protein [Clostridium beijerinckii]NRT78652.1 hypothetical protein [Clostridium beijerinckii]
MSVFTSLEDMSGGLENYSDYCKFYGTDRIKKCPICGVDILPKIYGDIRTKNRVISIMECPSCDEIFILKYILIREGKTPSHMYFKHVLDDVYPKKPDLKEFEKQINDISEKFVITYNQSQIAETHKLDQIAGMGYRKSIEYLIKDYIIYKNPEKLEEVQKEMLGRCISTMVDNTKIQKMAKGATWLGNDSTHYVRKWKDKDIEDLKCLIDLTVYWIMYELKTKEYEEIMKL